jgi:hypothetical protein
MPQQIFQPVAALILLTALVWVFMYARRIPYILINKLDVQQSGASPEAMNAALPDSVNRPSNNLKNLFEVPVLFYVLCLSLFALGKVDAQYMNLAWAYVGLRAAHSLIHCTVNIVNLRFTAYLLSSVVLGIMIVRFALQVFA